MQPPDGFAWTKRKNGEIEITHHGRRAAVLRGAAAIRFEKQLASKDEQQVMARFTGNYKRGNERVAGRGRADRWQA